MTASPNPPRAPVPEAAPSDSPATTVPSVLEAPSKKNSDEQALDWCGWTSTDRGILLGLAVLILCLCAIHLARLASRGGPVEIEHLSPSLEQYRLEINRATWVEFAQLPGIGESLAREIVRDRTANGPFATVDDLTRVRGIGDKKLADMRPWLVCEPAK